VFYFCRDDSDEDIYKDLYNHTRVPEHNWSLDDYNQLYEATKGNRDMLVQKLEEMFKVIWLEEPTERPKITIRKDEAFDRTYIRLVEKTLPQNKKYIKRKIRNASDRELKNVIEKYFDVRWV